METAVLPVGARARRRVWRPARWWPYALLAPSLLILAGVLIYPTLSGIDLSFHQMRLNRPGLGTGFVGLAHYAQILVDPVFWLALSNTVVWVAATVVLELALGLCAALALDLDLPGFRVLVVLVLLPWFLPLVVAGNIWALILDSRLGILNTVLIGLGILHEGKAWFADPNWALPAAILVEAWHGFPFFALLLLAALKGIPPELYEAASVDGASAPRRFLHVQLPALRMVIVATVVLRAISLVNAPDLLLILTGGGPGRATEVLSLYAFQKAFQEFDYGYAGALSVAVFVLLAGFSFLYVRLSNVLRD